MVRLFVEKSAVVEALDIDCPYCGESINIMLDNSAGEQEYYEDCSVCCRPILFTLKLDELFKLTLSVKTDDE